MAKLDKLTKRAKELLRGNGYSYKMVEAIMYGERDNYTGISDIAQAIDIALEDLKETK